MRVISNKALTDFAAANAANLPGAGVALQAWRKIVEGNHFADYAALNAAFNATDRAGDYYIFDVSGNKIPLIATIHFNRQMLFVRHVFTHKEYDRWNKLR